MPLMIPHQTVTVIRAGNRVKVKPNGAAYDFTESEVTAIEAGGGRLTAPTGPVAASVVVEKAPSKNEASAKPMTAAEKKAAAAAKAAEEDL